ncbi:MAG: hypothetical protein KJ630_01345 [Proteobacteria bacterium]|nr:hypothetical protein [Pseudomonadota bacterium]
MEDLYLTQLVPLTQKEEGLRKRLEEKVFTVVRQAYIEIGETLEEIFRLKLYKSTHHCFADYSRDVLDIAKRTAEQYIDAIAVVRNLQAIEHKVDSEKVRNCALFSLPKNESQARALVGLTPEEQRQAWISSLETAPEGKITAAHIRKTVREIKGEQTKETIEKVKRHKEPNQSREGEEFKEAFNVFLAAVQKEIFTNYKNTDRLTVVRHLDTIRGVISQNGNHRIPEPGYSIEASNTEKLLAAGFTLYRADTIRLIIEKAVVNGGWVVVEVFQEKDALVQAFDVLMLDLNSLRG